MRRRNGILAFALAAGLGLQPGQQACQTPVIVSAPAGGVEAWLYSGSVPGPTLGVTVSDARDSKLLAVGRISPGYREIAPPRGYPNQTSLRTRFDATVPAGKRITVCFLNLGPTAVALMGALPSAISGTLTSPAQSRGNAIALLFLRPHSQSLFSMLPTVFRRAMLFRPAWVGAWTFWVLASALVGCFAVGAFAIARASDADADGH
jgi:hypothetical protein